MVHEGSILLEEEATSGIRIAWIELPDCVDFLLPIHRYWIAFCLAP